MTVCRDLEDKLARIEQAAAENPEAIERLRSVLMDMIHASGFYDRETPHILKAVRQGLNSADPDVRRMAEVELDMTPRFLADRARAFSRTSTYDRRGAPNVIDAKAARMNVLLAIGGTSQKEAARSVLGPTATDNQLEYLLRRARAARRT